MLNSDTWTTITAEVVVGWVMGIYEITLKCSGYTAINSYMHLHFHLLNCCLAIYV